jgi:lysyl-tRNA synthetase
MAAEKKSDTPLERLIAQRVEKAEKIRAAGLLPYANDFQPEITCEEFLEKYRESSRDELGEVKAVHTVAGRIMALRSMGKATFLRIQDRTGTLQVFLQQDRVGKEAYKRLKLADLGDIIGVAGTPMRTKTEELTIGADGWRVLTKALRPLPDKWHGLTDVEQRYRQRYVDLVVNPDARRIFKARTRIISGIRKFLDHHDYLEVETPILGDLAGGANAKPFVTHHNSLGLDLYLRIATELHLKRLVVGGFERVYEIGRQFRNEGISTRHNPEFTSIEFYQAYATHEHLMDLTEEMLSGLVEELHGSSSISYQGNTLDFARPWRRATIAELVGEHLGMPAAEASALNRIASVQKAMSLADGHCVNAEEPLLICLKELTDDEAEQWIPGLPDAEEPDQPMLDRARAALKAGGETFYQELGTAIDRGLEIEEDDPASGFDRNDEVTDPAERDVTPEAGQAPLIPNEDVDHPRHRRRRLALHLLYAIFDNEVEEKLQNPTFVTDFSVSVSPLARRRDGDPSVVDRFELMCGGMEIANAFSELTDPVDQKGRFISQLLHKERGDDEAHALDEDFLRALEVGMPPTAGEGIGIDRLVMLLTDVPSIREVILFPQLKKEQAQE